MIPLRDNIRSIHPPIVNISIIVLCTLAFFAQLAASRSPGQPGLIEQLGMIPARVMGSDAPIMVPEVVSFDARTGRVVVRQRLAEPSAVPAILTPLTCIFLHGGWLHFLGNMWFLWIFGDNVEDRFGHLGYAVFYLFAGVAASFAHLITDPSSTIPTIGASGAIAGVMGAYFVWYLHSRVQALIPFFGFMQIAEVPAPYFLGIWFLMQFLQQGEGVAWWAHIGGFVVGAAIAWMLDKSNLLPPRQPSGSRPRQIWQPRHPQW